MLCGTLPIYDAIVRAILQRVSRAEVRVGDRVVGSIARGMVVLLGVARDDTEADAAFIADRTLGLRVFADNAGKMNLALGAVGGQLLVISQFTLLADTESGRRPSFVRAAPPLEAQRLYEHFISLVRQRDVKVETGEFGARMEVDLVNEGPVTIILDSRNRK
ncbi:MAG TPA: D-aminoacyl-tRNA deacylase [Candidatus Binataceae bacterium]